MDTGILAKDRPERRGVRLRPRGFRHRINSNGSTTAGHGSNQNTPANMYREFPPVQQPARRDRRERLGHQHPAIPLPEERPRIVSGMRSPIHAHQPGEVNIVPVLTTTRQEDVTPAMSRPPVLPVGRTGKAATATAQA